jgi:class 3 adenylate cyclase
MAALPADDEQALQATVLVASLRAGVPPVGDDDRLALTSAVAAAFERIVLRRGGRVVSVVDDRSVAVFVADDASGAIDAAQELAACNPPGAAVGPAIGLATDRIRVTGAVGVMGPAASRAIELAAVAGPGSVLVDVPTLLRAGRGALSSEPSVHRPTQWLTPISYVTLAGPVPVAPSPEWQLCRVRSWDIDRRLGFARDDRGEFYYFDGRHLVGSAPVEVRRRGFLIPRPPLVEGRNRVADPLLLVGARTKVEVEDNRGRYGFGGLIAGPVDTPPLYLAGLADEEPGDVVDVTIGVNAKGPMGQVQR